MKLGARTEAKSTQLALCAKWAKQEENYFRQKSNMANGRHLKFLNLYHSGQIIAMKFCTMTHNTTLTLPTVHMSRL